MLESLVQYHDQLPTLVRLPLDFFINVIIIRGILANEILQEMKQRGILKDGILHAMKQHMTKWTTIARKVAIVEHYRDGHHHNSVVECPQDRCRIFA